MSPAESYLRYVKIYIIIYLILECDYVCGKLQQCIKEIEEKYKISISFVLEVVRFVQFGCNR